MNFEGGNLEEALVGLVSQPHQALPVPAQKSQVKRPHNAYNLFFIERLPIEKDANPTLTGNEISHLIGKKWSEMDDESKRPYRERAQEIKARFREEYPDYHYQKGHTKVRKKKEMLENQIEDSMDVPQRIEAQMRNLFGFLGAQAVSQYLVNNKAFIDEVEVVVRNVTRMIGTGGAMGETMESDSLQ